MTNNSDSETGTTLSPLYDFSSEDHSSIIVIVTVVSFLTMVTVIVAKLLLHRKNPALYLFDYILLAAAFIVFIETSLTVWAAHLGLGKREDEVDGDASSRVLQLQYASSLLGIVAVAGAKCSLNLVIIAINDIGLIFYASRGLLALILVMSLGSLLAMAFQCPLPKPWLFMGTANCPHAITAYKFSIFANMITDLLLCGLAIVMVWDLRDRWAKALVVGLFCCRVVCPLTLLPSVVHFEHFYPDGYTWLAAWPTVWQQVSYNLSIITACIPSMKAVLDTFSGNTLILALHERYELETQVSKS